MVDDDDEIRDAPPAVVASVALGVAPLPFLAVYATLFIFHGTVQPVVPPDIGTSQHTELVAGLIAVALMIYGVVSVFSFLGGRRRWLFALGQAATLGTAIDFVIDTTTGSPSIPVLLAITSAAALVLAFLPQSWRHLRRTWWLPHRRTTSPETSRVPAPPPPSPTRPVDPPG